MHIGILTRFVLDMEEKIYIIINKKTRVCVPMEYYNFSKDDRLLIPCTDGEKAGFVDKRGNVIVSPQYIFWDGECRNEQEYIVVTKTDSVVKEGKLAGVINYRGEEIVPVKYLSIQPSLSSYYVFTVQRQDGKYAVITNYGDVIVPFGKYDKIHGFDKGFAKVRIKDVKTNKYKFGIIDEQGNVVLPLEWDRIRSFYKKNFSKVRVSRIEADGEITEKFIKLSDLGE